MPEIITDVDKLHQKSEPVSGSADDLIVSLCKTIPIDALGLAAPQIDEFKRVFIVNLSCGRFAFVNPEFTYRSPTKKPSVEGCLSIPKVSQCVERHTNVHLKAEKAVQWSVDTSGDVTILKEISDPFDLWGMDACIVQHEYDHLDGILITDLDKVPSRDSILQDNARNRMMRVVAKRHAKASISREHKNEISVKKTKSKKELQRDKNRVQKANRRRVKEMEIRERYSLEQEKLKQQKEKTPSPS